MDYPKDYCCPLSLHLMTDPVVAADGITYERSWVEQRLKQVPNESPSVKGQQIENSVPWQARGTSWGLSILARC